MADLEKKRMFMMRKHDPDDDDELNINDNQDI